MRREWLWAFAGMAAALAVGLVVIAVRSRTAKTPEQRKVRALVLKLLDPSLDARRDAARALGKMGPSAEDAIPDLRRAIDDDPQVVIWVHFALAQITETEEPSITAIAARLKDKDDALRGQAAVALGEMGPKAAKTLPALMEIVADDPNQVVKFDAQVAVSSMKEKAVPILTEALRHGRAQVRRYAATTLGNIGPDAYPALGALKDMSSTDADDTVKRTAQWAVQKIQAGK